MRAVKGAIVQPFWSWSVSLQCRQEGGVEEFPTLQYKRYGEMDR